MANPWSYDQWIAKYNAPTYWNPSAADPNQFNAQTQQLADTGWTQAQLYDASRYAQWINDNLGRQQSFQPLSNEPYMKPDFSPESNYTTSFAFDPNNPGLRGTQGNMVYRPISGDWTKTDYATPAMAAIQNPVTTQTQPTATVNQNRGISTPRTQTDTQIPYYFATGTGTRPMGSQSWGPVDRGTATTRNQSVVPQVSPYINNPQNTGGLVANPAANQAVNTMLSGTQRLPSYGIGNTGGIATPGTGYGQVTGTTGYSPQISPYVSNQGVTAPVLNTGSATTYNPTPWASTDTSNGFLNSSGGFAYDMLPGMYNYLMQYLSGNANQSSGVNQALTGYLGSNLTSQYPTDMSNYLQQMINTLGGGQLEFGTGQQGNAANTAANLAGGQGISTPIQQQATNQISQMLSGSGLTPDYINAVVQDVLKPALENNYGISNQMGGGVGEMSSGLPAELARRTTSDFTNQLIQQGYNNINNLLGQGLAAGGQSFGQGLNLAGLQGNLGQVGISNANAAMSQGQNLLGQYLNSLLGLQGNAQNYTTALTGQYGNLAQGLLSNKTASEAEAKSQASNKAATIGNILGSLLGGATGTSGAGGALPIQKAIDWIKGLFGGNADANAAIQDSALNPDTSIWNIISSIPNTGISSENLSDYFNSDELWNSLFGDSLNGLINPWLTGLDQVTSNPITSAWEPIYDWNWDPPYTGVTDMLNPLLYYQSGGG